MKICIDTDQGQVVVEGKDGIQTMDLSSPEGFAAISQAWLRSGWDTKYVYSFSWLGRPIIQLPEDMMRIQEVIYSIKPDVIIETGVAHGGSLVFYASICRAMGKGRVIGIDIEIRPHNRKAIEAHEMSEYITLFEGSSTNPEIINGVKEMIKPSESVLVILDSNHTKEHALNELRAYAPFVSEGSYIVACDGIMAQLGNAPRTQPDWEWNNPISAVQEFVGENQDFFMEEPVFPFNEGSISERITYWPKCFIRKKSGLGKGHSR